MEKKKILLHSCCAPCSTAVIERLADEFDITILYYNPNIFPEEEYYKRKNEELKYIEIYNSNHNDKIKFMDTPSLKNFISSMPFVCNYYILKKSFSSVPIDELNNNAGPSGIVAKYGNIHNMKKVELDFIEDFKITYQSDLIFAEKLLKSQ